MDGSTTRTRPLSTINDLIHPLTTCRARPYLRDGRGRNALMLAAENGHTWVVDICIRIGLDADASLPPPSLLQSPSSASSVSGVSEGGDSALHVAARRGHRFGKCEG